MNFPPHFIFLVFLLVSAFTPLNQDALPDVSVLNRKNEFVSEITDRDRVQIRVTISQLAAPKSMIHLRCSIPAMDFRIRDITGL